MTAKKVFIIVFFAIQVFSIIYQLEGETNFFNWSMYHTCIEYNAKVTIDGKELTENEFYERYRIRKSGIEGKALGHLKRIFTKREAIYDDKNVIIELNYIENTHKNVWKWSN